MFEAGAWGSGFDAGSSGSWSFRVSVLGCLGFRV